MPDRVIARTRVDIASNELPIHIHESERAWAAWTSGAIESRAAPAALQQHRSSERPLSQTGSRAVVTMNHDERLPSALTGDGFEVIEQARKSVRQIQGLAL